MSVGRAKTGGASVDEIAKVPFEGYWRISRKQVGRRSVKGRADNTRPLLHLGFRSNAPAQVPVVFTRAVLARLKGDYRLMVHLLYGSGQRLLECLRLRIKDIDFGYRQITLREFKGMRERVTLLPERLVRPLQAHLARIKEVHRQDLVRGGGAVFLPTALHRKYPNAAREWIWQYAFSC